MKVQKLITTGAVALALGGGLLASTPALAHADKAAPANGGKIYPVGYAAPANGKIYPVHVATPDSGGKIYPVGYFVK